MSLRPKPFHTLNEAAATGSLDSGIDPATGTKPATETVETKRIRSHEPDIASTAKAHDAAGTEAPGQSSRLRLTTTHWDRYLVRTGALVMAIMLWHFVSVNDINFFISFENVPDPVTVGIEFIELLGSQAFYVHVLHSLQRIAIAYALAAVLGVMLGVMMGRSRIAEDIILPYIELLRPIPAVAWIPLAILMMPSEQASIVFITFLGALFPIVLNTVHGIEQSSKVLIRAARSLGASNTAILWHVVIPGAMPSIVAGLAIGMGVAWFSLLAGEIISGQYGIGYFTWAAYTLIEYPRIIIGMLVIGGLGSLCTLLVRKACFPLLRWQKEGTKS